MNKIYAFDIPNLSIGSGTVEEHSFQICNFMNMMYNCIHYADKEERFKTHHCMTPDVIHHNILVDINNLEKKETSKVYYSIKYKEMIQTIVMNLNALSIDDSNEMIESVKELCNRLWFKTYDDLKRRFSLINKFTYIK